MKEFILGLSFYLGVHNNEESMTAGIWSRKLKGLISFHKQVAENEIEVEERYKTSKSTAFDIVSLGRL